jgi:hypothetical protein
VDTDKVLLGKINAAVAEHNAAEKAATAAQSELVSKSKVVGQLLLEAKKLRPKVKDFEAFLKRVKGLKLSRAYDLLRLAGGRTTDEELRKEARERKQKSRAKKKLPLKSLPLPKPEPISVTKPHVTESLPRITASPEISAEERRAQNAALDSGEGAAKASATALEEFKYCCRIWLPKITAEADRQKASQYVADLMTPKAEAA